MAGFLSSQTLIVSSFPAASVLIGDPCSRKAVGHHEKDLPHLCTKEDVTLREISPTKKANAA